MQAAWLAFAALGRSRHPDLVVVFSMLAGAAPLLSERLDTRGGPAVDLRDPRVFYDTSSYGPAAVEAIARRVGPEQLVYGSDRPVLEPLADGSRARTSGERGAAAVAYGGRRREPRRRRARPFVASLVARRERWEHLVRHADDMRVYEQIWDDADVNAWVICWSEDQDTGFHDHDLSAAAIAVISGAVREDRMRLGAGPLAG